MVGGHLYHASQAVPCATLRSLLAFQSKTKLHNCVVPIPYLCLQNALGDA